MHYYFHLGGPSETLIDPEGAECADASAAIERALRAARDIIAEDVRGGILDLRQRIEIEDSSGRWVRTLRFTDAVDLTTDS